MPHTEHANPTSTVEPRLRRLVADRLGLNERDLASELSLTQDFAADSLDLADLAVGVEEQFGVAVPDATLYDVRTYGDLVTLVDTLVHARIEAEARRADAPYRVVARFTPVAGARPIERVGLLTPYLAEVLADDVRHRGPGARLDVSVVGADEHAIDRVRSLLGSVAAHGVDVHVQRKPLADGRVHPSAA